MNVTNSNETEDFQSFISTVTPILLISNDTENNTHFEVVLSPINFNWGNYFTQASGPYLALVCAYIMGGIMGICWLAFVYEMFGRRGPLIETSILISLVWIFRRAIKTKGFQSFIRFSLGFAHGAFSLGLPIFIAESSQVSQRGLRCFYFISDGLMGSFFGFCVYTYVKSRLFKVFLNHVILMGLIQIVLSAQSPYWQPPPKTSADMWKDFQIVASSKNIWKSIGICMMLLFVQELTSLSIMTKIMPSLLRQLNSNMISSNATALLLLLQLLGSIIGGQIVDSWGRRAILFISLTLVSISSLVYALFLTVVKNQRAEGQLEQIKGKSIIWLGAGSTILFCIAFNLGLRPIAWLTMAEFLPVKSKGFTGAIVIIPTFFVAYLFDIFVTCKTFNDLSENQQRPLQQQGLYWHIWIPVCISLIAIPSVYIFVPEMMGMDFPPVSSAGAEQ